MQKKSFNSPDETLTPPNADVAVVKIGGTTLVRNTYKPGWKWSEHAKPMVGTDSCQVHHLICVISGRIHVTTDDGAEMEFGPGDVADIPPGHDAWVVGDEPVVGIDVGGAVHAKA